MEILLNDEEIKALRFAIILDRSTPEDILGLYAKGVAKAQLKAVAKWGEELCYDHNGTQRKEQGWHVKRHECPICWLVLLKEVDDDS